MTRDEKIARIVEILNENEEHLSDGYQYYFADADALLKGIAESIVESFAVA